MKDARLLYRPDLFDPCGIFTAYCNADHADNADNGCSTGGYALLITGAAVSWSSCLQTITALSTTKVEYVSAVDTSKEVAWMRQLLNEFGFKLPAPLTLAMDNQSAISVAKNPEHHGHMKCCGNHLRALFLPLDSHPLVAMLALSRFSTSCHAP